MKGFTQVETIIMSLIVLIALLAVSYVLLSQSSKTTDPKPCPDYKDSVMSQVPARCVNYFNQLK